MDGGGGGGFRVPRKVLWGVGSLALVLVAAVSGWLLWGVERGQGERRRDLQRRLSEAGVERSSQLASDVLSDSVTLPKGMRVRSWAEVFTWFRERRDKGKFVAWSRTFPRDVSKGGRTLGPQALVDRLDRGTSLRAYPIELAVAASAVLRSLGHGVRVVELQGVHGLRAPLDPAGRYGYYAVAHAKKGPVYDVYAGLTRDRAACTVRFLADGEVAAGMLLVDVNRWLEGGGRDGDALRLSEAVLALDDRLAAAHGVHGLVLARTGRPDLALEAWARARRIRSRGAHEVRWFMGQVASGRMDETLLVTKLQNVLKGEPDFVWPRILLSHVFLSKGDLDRASSLLQGASQLDREHVDLPIARALLAAAQGDERQTRRNLREAMTRRPGDWETRVQGARALSMLGDREAVKAQVRDLLPLVPDARREEVRRMMVTLFGPGVLEEDGSGQASELPSPDRFQLSDPTTSTGPSLLGGDDLRLDLGP